MLTIISVALFILQTISGWGIGMEMGKSGPYQNTGKQLIEICIQVFLLCAAIYLWTIRNGTITS